MIDPLVPLRQRVEAALRAAFPGEAAGVDLALHRSAHADYQADAPLQLGRALRRSPRDVAAELVRHLPSDEVLAGAAVSGPGFVNLTLRSEHLAAEADRMLADERLGVDRAARPEVVVVDYSAPNLAKELHVGHLRSTIIGDALVRMLEAQGHRAVRQNHIGDWGTPFGMLIEHLRDQQGAGAGAGVRELSGFYRAARARFDADAAFADRSRARVVRLQGADPETLALWQSLLEVTLQHLDALYAELGVTLQREHVCGESRYNAELPGLVAELTARGFARESQGAVCAFPPGFTGRDGEELPLILRKQDGGFTYAATDLAALRHRVRDLGATRILYVVGAPQAQHLAMVFATARLGGWLDGVEPQHVAFGSVLGPDRKMLKTRAGEAVSLAGLLREAVERARALVDARSPELDEPVRARIAAAVGVGAVKYADLSNDRVKDYVFDLDRMLAFEGNTAPYLMYAHARIRSILRRSGVEMPGAGGEGAALRLLEPAERALALELLQFPRTVEWAVAAREPHRLCQHLHAAATRFTAFYDACPVLRAEGPVRASRLSLCQLTARVLERGLSLLGLAAPTPM